ncbi:MAG: chromosomal replication initiator protein DnaA [Candidatus Saccharibacteria bacterium]|nr:chromosomal replication initiator protein DnaA [Candidatus Saccharibacteria bacterium]
MFDVWENVLADLKSQVGAQRFSTYLSKTSLESSEGGNIQVGVPNSFMQINVKKLFNTQIIAALRKNRVEVKDVEYVIVNKFTGIRKAREVNPTTESKNQKGSIPALKTKPSLTTETNLNPKYTMENFVEGANNDLAVSVARNIIDNPGTKYNPFFLYGGSGLGKTHLVQAIGNALYKNRPELKILYTPINHFYSEFVNATRNGKMDQFAKKYKQLDVFIIDDFQFIIGKEKSQQEFFDIFNDMHQMNKQVIITSDRLPSQIETVDERLASRLTMAGAFDVQFPSFEDRCAILKSKAEFEGVTIEDEAIEYIANNVNTNIRDLESEYARLITIADLKGKTPLEIIKGGGVQPTVNIHNKTTTPKKVVEKVAKFYSLSVSEMTGKSRVAHIKNARHVAMYLLSEDLHLSTTKIATEVGVKDHTTVMHGIRKIKNDLTLNFELREHLSEIRNSLYA